jgi:hypothetical protein
MNHQLSARGGALAYTSHIQHNSPRTQVSVSRVGGSKGKLRIGSPGIIIAACSAIILCALSHAAMAASTTISYVQGNYATPQSSQSTVKIIFTAAQTAGNLNVVAVGWNDSAATVSAVSDTSGNTYTLAVGPTVQSGVASQSIYYAKNIRSAAAGANTVTVTFSTAAAYPDIRVLEYSGADPNNPVDVTAAANGSSSTSKSASATTTNSTDLILGANLVQTSTTGSGSGFTKRLLTSPDGDIAEDRMVTSTGSYNAAAPLGASGKWIMQMVAFRTPSGGAASTYLLSASPTSLNFGNVTVGATSAAQTVTLTNTGTASVTASQATVTGAGFSIGGLSLPLTVAAGQSATFSVTFAPAVAGSVTGSVSVVSNATGSQASVALSGTGVAVSGQVSISPGSLAFGNVTLGSDAILPVVMTNSSSAPITITQATVTGAGFSVGGLSLPYTLAAGQNASLSVTFAPTAAGSSTGTVSVVSNVSGSPASVAVSGAGIHSVSLSWTASTSSGVTGYNVFRGTTSGGPYTQLNGSPVGTTSYTDSAVQAGQTYYYVTTAVNGSGTQSGYSTLASAIVPSP